MVGGARTAALTAGPAPGALPRQRTPFVGRTAELAAVAALLQRSRLVTVLGPGGVGKTRIAVQAAAAAAARYPGGACFVDLSALCDPELLAHTVAEALDLPGQDAGSQLDLLLDYVRGRSLLLVLDTCEHLRGACALLAELVLDSSPGTTVLATSRSGLGAPGEQRYTVPPLAVPRPGDPHGGPAGGDAVQLFERRAAAAVPGFALTPDSRRDAVRLCRRLDGIPLAIELATVRLRVLPLAQLADRIEEEFRCSGAAEPPGQQTLRTGIGWTYGLCTPQEQLLWQRLSVFSHTFDAAAAEEVCAGGELEEWEVLEALIGLVDKSVVLRGGGGGRYRLLDTLREYGAERLAEAGGRAEYAGRHLDRLLRMADRFERHFTDDGQLPRLRALAEEHAGIREALAAALSAPGRVLDAARLPCRLWAYWQTRGRLKEGRYWLSRVLDALGGEHGAHDGAAVGGPGEGGAPARGPAGGPGLGDARAWCLVVRAHLATFQGLLGAAEKDLERARPLVEASGDALLHARYHVHRHQALAFLGRGADAEDACAAAERAADTAGDAAGQVGIQVQHAYLLFVQGQLDGAVERCAAGLERLGAGSREHWLRSYLLLITSAALLLKGDREGCRAAGCEAVRMKLALHDTAGIAYALEVLAWLAVGEHRYTRACWLAGAAGPLWERCGTRLGGDAAAEVLHREAAAQARAALGEGPYAAARAEGMRHPVEHVVAAAVADADRVGGATASGAGAAGRGRPAG